MGPAVQFLATVQFSEPLFNVLSCLGLGFRFQCFDPKAA
jgi:hypothetical protein